MPREALIEDKPREAMLPPPLPPPRLVDKRTTFLLIPNAEHEDRIGRAYIESVYGDDIVARVVQAIPLARLTDESHVIVIARRRIKPVFNRQPDATGMPQEYPIAIEELIQEVKEREPIAIANHWLEDHEMGGKLNTQTFFETLNRAAQPFCVRHRGDEGLIRLFYL